MTPKQFFIPRVSPAQIGMIAARSAGVIAASLAAEARNNASKPNPFNGRIDTTDTRVTERKARRA